MDPSRGVCTQFGTERTNPRAAKYAFILLAQRRHWLVVRDTVTRTKQVTLSRSFLSYDPTQVTVAVKVGLEYAAHLSSPPETKRSIFFSDQFHKCLRTLRS
jgi:hypothetical protein